MTELIHTGIEGVYSEMGLKIGFILLTVMPPKHQTLSFQSTYSYIYRYTTCPQEDIWNNKKRGKNRNT